LQLCILQLSYPNTIFATYYFRYRSDAHRELWTTGYSKYRWYDDDDHCKRKWNWKYKRSVY